MVARVWSQPGRPGTDAADALGIAICHAHSRDTLTLIASAGIKTTTAGATALGGPLAGMRMKRGRLVG